MLTDSEQVQTIRAKLGAGQAVSRVEVNALIYELEQWRSQYENVHVKNEHPQGGPHWLKKVDPLVLMTAVTDRLAILEASVEGVSQLAERLSTGPGRGYNSYQVAAMIREAIAGSEQAVAQ